MSKLVNTGVALPSELHLLLRDAARARQRARGGRASASALIVEFVRAHEGELRAELQAEGRSKEASK
jgi:hypothetical protein